MTTLASNAAHSSGTRGFLSSERLQSAGELAARVLLCALFLYAGMGKLGSAYPAIAAFMSVEQSTFDDYRVLRMNEAPVIETHIVHNTEAPGGIGEPGTCAVIPAISNAIFAATGKRSQWLPADRELLRQG
jgi:hypothetical protein